LDPQTTWRIPNAKADPEHQGMAREMPRPDEDLVTGEASSLSEHRADESFEIESDRSVLARRGTCPNVFGRFRGNRE
jgi:hypothetical protein